MAVDSPRRTTTSLRSIAVGGMFTRELLAPWEQES